MVSIVQTVERQTNIVDINATKFHAFQKVKVVNVEVSRHILFFCVNDLHDFMWAHHIFSRFTHFFSLLLFIFFCLFSVSFRVNFFAISFVRVDKYINDYFSDQDTLFKPLPYSPEMIVRSNIIRLKSFSGCHFLFGLLFCVCVCACVFIFRLSLCVWLVIFVLRIFFCFALLQQRYFFTRWNCFTWTFSKIQLDSIVYTCIQTSTVKASWVFIGFSRDSTEIRLSIHILR